MFKKVEKIPFPLPLTVLTLFVELHVFVLKGVLHPRPVFWLFMYFSQKLQHIGDKLDMFLLGNILGNLITALEFTNSSGYWFMVQNIQKYWFSHIFHYNFTTMAFTEVKLWFLSSLEHFWPDP